ncbi:hypothetical protein ABZY03_33920, partial [Streptomyces klenkii]|uniref:hypothetical protein n=1 Tax=Streptomyces klenkii TaxID=1420899 RepID=UPI0033A81016
MAWVHNGHPGFTTHDSWHSAHTAAAHKLDTMANGLIYTGGTWTATVAAAHLCRCANQIHDLVLTTELGDVDRSHLPAMKEDRAIGKGA